MAFGHWDPTAYLEDIPKRVLRLRSTEPLVRRIMN